MAKEKLVSKKLLKRVKRTWEQYCLDKSPQTQAEIDALFRGFAARVMERERRYRCEEKALAERIRAAGDDTERDRIAAAHFAGMATWKADVERQANAFMDAVFDAGRRELFAKFGIKERVQ